MSSTPRTSSTLPGLALGALAALVLVSACTEPLPQDVPQAEEAPRPSAAELALEPMFTPFTVAPSILNREEIVQAMRDAYPALLREAGIGGTINVFFHIDEEGQVRATRVHRSSGHEALDEAALSVASVFRFEPALNGRERTPVWVSLPITFQVR